MSLLVAPGGNDGLSHRHAKNAVPTAQEWCHRAALRHVCRTRASWEPAASCAPCSGVLDPVGDEDVRRAALLDDRLSRTMCDDEAGAWNVGSSPQATADDRQAPSGFWRRQASCAIKNAGQPAACRQFNPGSLAATSVAWTTWSRSPRVMARSRTFGQLAARRR